MALCVGEIKDSVNSGFPGGLSQEELDALCVASDDDDMVGESSSPPSGDKGTGEFVRPDSTESFGCLACFAGWAGLQAQRMKTEHAVKVKKQRPSGKLRHPSLADEAYTPLC